MKRPTLTTEAGAPVGTDQHAQTAGVGGPVLLQDHHLTERLARFNRERIPERVVHAVGSGAYGRWVPSGWRRGWRRRMGESSVPSRATGWMTQRASLDDSDGLRITGSPTPGGDTGGGSGRGGGGASPRP